MPYQHCLSILEKATPKEDEIPALLQLAHVYELPSVFKRCIEVLKGLGKEAAKKAMEGAAWKDFAEAYPELMSKVTAEMSKMIEASMYL